MARYQIPYQNIDVDVPDEGQIFRGGGPAGTNTADSAYVRYGGTLYQIPKAQFTGNFEALSEINPATEGLNYLTKGKTVFGDVSPFQRALTEGARTGETISLTINPQNPQGTIVSSNLQGYQTTQTPTGTFQGGQFTQGATAPKLSPLPGQTQALQGQTTPKTFDISSFSPEQKTAFNTSYNLGNKSFGVTGGTPPQSASTGSFGPSGGGGMGSLQGQYPGGLGGSDALFNTYLGTLSPTTEETALRGQLDTLIKQQANINASKDLGIANIQDQQIATPFITGQSTALERQAIAKMGALGSQAVPLQTQLANLQAKRQSAVDISREQLARQDKMQQQVREDALYVNEFALSQSKIATAGQQTQFEQDLATKKFEEDKRQFGLKYAQDQQKLAFEKDLANKSAVTGKPLTDSERSALGYATRMVEADSIIDRIGNKFTGVSSYGGQYLPNILQSSDRQQFEQAKRNFVNAVLRRESGAVISDQEFANAERQYFPQPGDTAGTLAQKDSNRATVIRNLQLSGGQAVTNNDPLGIR